MNKLLINKKNIIIFFIIFLISIILRLYYFSKLDSWFDEWNMLYTVDPFITNTLTWERFFGDRGDGFLPEYYPPINAFILKYFLLITGYCTENARIYSLLFGSLSTWLIYILSNMMTNKKKEYFATFLFSINLFLIWQSNEIRPHSFVLFFSLLNIILFIKIINNNKGLILYLSYIIFSILLLSSWPFALTIYFGKTIYAIFHYKIKKIKINRLLSIFFIILIFYIFINNEYLIYHLKRTEHYTNLKITFFYSFHFRSFFGSIFMGGIFLILFSFFFLKDFKKNFLSDNNLNVIFYIIICTYLLTISYSILRAGVISPKYVIFILPLIIIWITQKIRFSKYYKKIIFLLIIFNIFNTSYNFFNNPISRPPLKKVINIISKSDTKEIVTNESLVFNNAFTNYKAFKKNKLTLIDSKKEDISMNKFWFVCLNNPRFAVGNEILPVENKCKIIDENKKYKEIEEIKIEDLYVKKYSIYE